MLLQKSGSAILPVIHKISDNRRVGQGRGISQIGIIIRRDFAQDAAHDLAGSCFRQLRGPLQKIGRRDGPDFLARPLAQFGNQIIRCLNALDKRDIGIDP